MNDHPVTPVLCEHARARAAEMGVRTRAVKRVVQHPDIRRTDYGDRWLAVSDEYPDIAVVYTVQPDGGIVVITVLYRSYEEYSRSA